MSVIRVGECRHNIILEPRANEKMLLAKEKMFSRRFVKNMERIDLIAELLSETGRRLGGSTG